MNKTLSALIGSVAAVGTTGAAQAAVPAADTPPDPLAARSYAQLLDPIPNAAALLMAADAATTQQPSRPVQLAQFRHHHHHHHHHHHSFYPGVILGAPFAAAPACYWTWAQPYWNGYRWVRRRVQVCD